MSRIPRGLSVLMVLVAGLMLVQQADALRGWWYNRCPGGDFARTPDECAPCTCGYRPGPGGGDCAQYPDNFCFPFQKEDLTCKSDYAFLNVNGVPDTQRVSSYCDAGFSCRNSESGPWCCPTKRVTKPKKNPARLGAKCEARA